jgi:hypothetical protein
LAKNSRIVDINRIKTKAIIAINSKSIKPKIISKNSFKKFQIKEKKLNQKNRNHRNLKDF